MEQNEAVAEIKKHRAEIDALDEKLVQLLNERAGHSLAIRYLKPAANMPHFDSGREDAILSRLEALNEGPLNAEDIRKIYENLLIVMKEFRADDIES